MHNCEQLKKCEAEVYPYTPLGLCVSTLRKKKKFTHVFKVKIICIKQKGHYYILRILLSEKIYFIMGCNC